MSHEVETMAYADETPWHGLGVPVSNDLTPEQIMAKAGLDWEVSKYTLYADVKGKRVKSLTKALVRSSDSSILTNVGPNWEPVQNSEAFEFFSEFVLAGDMSMHTAGSLKKGQMVWALAKVNDSFDVLGKDRVDAYMLFSNPHQYGKAVTVKFTPIRVVCNNTLTFALEKASKNWFSATHTKKFDAEEVKETMGLAHEKFAQYKDLADFLARKRFTVDSMLEFYSTVFPGANEYHKKAIEKPADLSRPARKAHEVLETQPGAELGEGTFWALFNSVTYSADHVLSLSQDNRLYNSWFGGMGDKKILALNTAKKLAEVA